MNRLTLVLSLALVLLAYAAPVAAQDQSQPGALSPVAILPGLGMIGIGLAFIIYALRRRLGGAYLAFGGLLWFITVALKLAWATLVNPSVYQALGTSLPPTPAVLLASAYVGSLTGVFECGISYLVLLLSRYGRVPWGKALAFGIGFGAIEAILLGINPLASAILYWTNPSAIPPEAVPNILALNNVLLGLAPIWERFFTILIHIFTSVLLFLAVRRGARRYFWLSFVFKSVLDAIAGYAQLTGLVTPTAAGSLGVTWLIEAIVGVLGIIAWYGIRWVEQSYPPEETTT